MINYRYFSLFTVLSILLMACDSSIEKLNDSGAGDKVVTVVDVSSLIKEFKGDYEQISYAFGKQLRLKVNRQAAAGLNENSFLNAFQEGRKNKGLNIQEINQKLFQLRKSLESNPEAIIEYSKYLGLYFGFNESENQFLNQLMVVNFADGFTSVIMDDGVVLLNFDSIYNSQQNTFNEFIGKRFLEENKKQEGVIETASGLQYKVLVEGNGEKPSAQSEVTVHYTGALITGKVFDSSISRGQPISFNLQGVIKGWTEGLQLMPVGSKYRLYIPYELGYGGQVTSSIPAYSTLIFDVELLAI